MAATTTGVMDMVLCGSTTTVQAGVAIGTTSGDRVQGPRSRVQAHLACLSDFPQVQNRKGSTPAHNLLTFR